MRRLFILGIVLLPAWLFAGRAEAAQRIAIIFGNSEYLNAPRLPNPVNDASDVAAAFERLAFSVRLLKNATFDTMRRGLLDFAQQAEAADIAVVYFAGHGMEIRDENWLVPVDAELRMDISANQEAVGLSSIMPIVSKARKLGLIILDACRDNPFSRQLRASRPGRALPARGLLPVEPPGSVLVVFAAKHGTTAADGTARNSPFTTALLHNLEIPGLEINYLFRSIHDEVYGVTQQRQEPYVYGTLSREPVYLKPPADPTAQTGPAPNSEAARAWAEIKDTNDPDVLNTFISRFGDSFYADVARARLTRLPAPQIGKTTPAASLPQQDKAVSSSSPTDSERKTSDDGVVGQWSWRAQCPVFGNFEGTVRFSLAAGDKLTGVISDDSGDWNIFDGRVRDGSISFRRKVVGGATQHWTGSLERPKAANSQFRGSITDSRFAIGTCSWKAVKG